MIAHLLLFAALPVEITVRVTADPAPDPCFLASRVPESLRRVFPGLSVILEGEAESKSGDAARMRLRLTASPSSVKLELDDAAGRALLRELPSSPEACAATADGIALVVERFLRDLGYEPSATPLPEIAPPVTTSTRATATGTGAAGTGATGATGAAGAGAAGAAGAGSGATGTAGAGAAGTGAASTGSAGTGPPGESTPLSLSLGAIGGGALGFGPSVALQPAAMGSARLRVGSSFELIARGGWRDFPTQAFYRALLPSRQVGTLTGWFAFALAGGGACWLERRLCADAMIGADIFSPHRVSDESIPASPDNAPHPHASVLLGLSARADLPLGDRFGLTLDASLLAHPQEISLDIPGTTPSYAVPRVTLIAGAGLWVTIF